MSLKPSSSMPKNDREWQRWCRDSYDQRVKFGEGSPEGVVVADRGTIYMRTDGGVGTTMYAKEEDDGLATGWHAK